MFILLVKKINKWLMLKNSLKKISFCREEIKVKAKVLFKIINNKYLKIKIN